MKMLKVTEDALNYYRECVKGNKNISEDQARGMSTWYKLRLQRECCVADFFLRFTCIMTFISLSEMAR